MLCCGTCPRILNFLKTPLGECQLLWGEKHLSLLAKALPGRTNIIITSSKNWQINDTIAVANINEAIKTAEATNAKEIFITGGGEIYIQAMPKANKIYRTLVHTNIDGDTFFPKIDETVWVKTFEKNVAADEKNVFDMSFQTWERIGVVNDE